MDQKKIIAGRSIFEVLKRFDKKLKTQDLLTKVKKLLKLLDHFLKLTVNYHN